MMYRANVNLGTLYELLGHNEPAYKLIQKALNLEPDSHLGSEWIHLKVLDLKRRGLATEAYLRDHFLIFVDSVAEQDPKEIRKIGQQLEYQLIERMTFIREQDPVVGRLLFELGNISVRLGGYDEAVKIYAEARRYGFNNADLEAKEAFAREHRQSGGVATFLRVHGWQVSAIGLSILLAITLLLMLIRKEDK